jgi:CBS domain-containing protein
MERHSLEDHEEEYLKKLEGRDNWPISEAIFERPVQELKRRTWVAMQADTKIFDAAREMVSKRIGSVIVTEGGKVAGIVTERDLLNQMVEHPFDPQQTPLRVLMTADVHTLKADETVALAIHRMSQWGHRRLPIVDQERRPVGLVSVRDIVDYLAVLFPHKILTMPPDPGKIPETREGG